MTSSTNNNAFHPNNNHSGHNPNANIVRPCGYSSSECGYCKGKRSELVGKTPQDSSQAYGVLVDTMTLDIYEDFLYRGWRRSGIHLYKPCNFSSCCPTITIRLPVDQFQMSKSQRKVLKRMNTILAPTTASSEANTRPKSQTQDAIITKSGILELLEEQVRQGLPTVLPNSLLCTEYGPAQWNFRFKIRPVTKNQPSNQIIVATSICAQIAGKRKDVDRAKLAQDLAQVLATKVPPNTVQNVVTVAKWEGHPGSGQVLVHLALNDDKPSNQKPTDQDDITMGESPADKLAEWYQQTFQKPLDETNRQITIRTYAAHASALDPAVHRLYALYQHVVHNDPDPFVPRAVAANNGNDTPPQPNPDLPPLSEIDWGNAPPDWKSQVESMFSIYLKEHPVSLHASIVSHYYNFYQFLVESPFPLNASPNPSVAEGQQGTVHQHYTLGDGTLIAVGVIDILPKGVSSVYLFYHPTFSHQLVALGKYAILKEVEYTQQLRLPYYYLGYYIESCPKMRYKAEYQPSQLLCPKYYKWVDAAEATKKLQQTPIHVCALSDDQGDDENDTNKSRLIGLIPMDIGAGMNVTIDMLQDQGREVVRPFLEEFIQEAGPILCRKCLIKLN